MEDRVMGKRVSDPLSWAQSSAIMARYNTDQNECRRQLLEAAIETGARLRHILVPILHRWGMGMDRGGSLYYMHPNGGGGCVEMGQYCDYALQSMICDALWAETGVEDGDTLHNYVEYIPLPTEQECKREYVWIVSDGDEEPYALSLDDCKDKTIAELSGRTYHGPVSLAYYEDMLLNEDSLSFIGVLPKYRACMSNKWVRVEESSDTLSNYMTNQSNRVCIPPERLEALEGLVKAVSDLHFGESRALPWCIESFPVLKAALDKCKEWELHANEGVTLDSAVGVPKQSITSPLSWTQSTTSTVAHGTCATSPLSQTATSDPLSWTRSTTSGLTLHYGNEHPATKDCYVDDTALQLAYQDVYTSTGLVVEAALCLIMEGVLKDVSIIIEGRPLTINPDHGIVTDIARFPSKDYSKRLMLAMIGKYKKPV